ncbi:uncharacterized protein N7483_000031 [Penicillium malachiteum]|uniref:uncharacterized protein n=1 Tax=Penicillium malachiteum TaxID=1324776 RepID=UPI002548B63F|nr:uncharacterized protein N7483_000031 [Penicillium malachiteum]KAJ5734906.1 hypothetical protein N7483_000031 [Penicillium malachiteum]
MIESKHKVNIPCTNTTSFVFSAGNQTPSSQESPQYFDADVPSRCFTMAQAKVWVKQFAKGLESLGLGPNGKVLLFSENRLYFPVLLWGVSAVRCIFTAASPSASIQILHMSFNKLTLHMKELNYQIQDSDAKVLLVGQKQVPVALEAARKSHIKNKNVFLFCHPEEEVPAEILAQIAPWTSIWRPAEEVQSWSWRKIDTREEAEGTTVILNYSSGTTGLPKGVKISHYNIVANCTQLLYKLLVAPEIPKGIERKERLATSGERWLAPLPMNHGQAYYCVNAVILQAKVFIMKSFSVQKYLLYMDIYHITFMATVPAIMATTSKQQNPSIYNLRTIETVLSGSAPLSPDLGRLIENLYLRPGVSVKQGWGMTETTCSITGFAPDIEDDGRSIGWLNPNCAARIEQLDDRDFSGVAPQGALLGRFGPQETEEAIVEAGGLRWLRTGDIGYIDDRGCIYIVDRLKDLIKVKGLQVAPAELEQYLLTHPDMADAAVVGAKIGGGEYPRAFIVRKGKVVTKKEIQEMIKLHFASHKCLTGSV